MTTSGSAQHRADLFLDPADDPRAGGVSLGDERATLTEFLRGQRLTLQLKCQGLEPDGDFDGAVGDQACVDDAWADWRTEVAFAEAYARDTDLGHVGRDSAGQPISLRELLVHMVEEYARHNGHADLLRERIDGRLGQ